MFCGSAVKSRVSILILLDGTLEDRRQQNRQAGTNMFQSLFYWMVLWKVLAVLAVFKGKDVSILILLDGTLEVTLLEFYQENGESFNPYFIGWYSGRMPPILMPPILTQFQSLFYWMVLWKIIVVFYS